MSSNLFSSIYKNPGLIIGVPWNCYVNTTWDESAVFSVEHSKFPLPKKARQVWSNEQSVLICLLDIQGTVPTSTDGERKILLRVSGAFEWKHPPQTSKNVAHQILGPASWQCSGSGVACFEAVFGCYEHDSHLTLHIHWICEFLLFPMLKLTVKWRHLDSTKKIQAESQDVMKTLKRYVFQQCFRSLKYPWNRCVSAEGDYFEEDGDEKKFPSAVKMRQRNSWRVQEGNVHPRTGQKKPSYR